MASVVLVLQAICVKLSSMISGRFALFTRNHEQTDKEEKKSLENLKLISFFFPVSPPSILFHLICRCFSDVLASAGESNDIHGSVK